ncbi:hypothetical protein H257_08832 [Aphanomyces astaci]|uniref:Uncharacterized protein n=1 Tax=Aphanomyces astaci TaxID=112090 RepID=W4GEB3_APHAT|nr:hypothetical protein H257_08832 [Aphanomyces astaci]ETV77414.1 hypothetical protein H257_08832 [Aphanomyces astaci]|eukprot:XP_009833201.1 hypothetical protein H257_08832 [Aphanomyces astaci]
MPRPLCNNSSMRHPFAVDSWIPFARAKDFQACPASCSGTTRPLAESWNSLEGATSGCLHGMLAVDPTIQRAVPEFVVQGWPLPSSLDSRMVKARETLRALRTF